MCNFFFFLGTTDIILSADYPVEKYTLAKTLKAIVGALIESQSEARAAKFIRDIILTQLADKDINEFYVIDEPLKVLTDILEREGREAPEPRIIGQSAAADILACYTVGIYCSKELIGEGKFSDNHVRVSSGEEGGSLQTFLNIKHSFQIAKSLA